MFTATLSEFMISPLRRLVFVQRERVLPRGSRGF